MARTSNKTQVYFVASADGTQGPKVERLIRGTLKEVEAMLRQEITIAPCTAEQAHQMANTEIEQAGE